LFGSPTCGVSTANLANIAVRNMKIYGDAINPGEIVDYTTIIIKAI